VSSTAEQLADNDIRRVPYRVVPEKVRKVKRVAKDIDITNEFIVDVCDTLRMPGRSPMAIVYKQPTDQELNEWMSTVSGYIQGHFSFDGKPLLLEDYQETWVDDDSEFRIGGKSRRVGLSLAEACKRLAKAMLINIGHNTTILSYTLEEAIGKIDYARALWDSIPTRYKKGKFRDRRQSLEFHDPVSGTMSKILSHAQRGPRGGGGSIVLDEFAHFQWPYKILEAALACILTGGGDISIISTPFGEGDPFHDILTNLEQYSHYSRHLIHWWDCRWLCDNVPEARERAPKMTTEERVMRYGSKKLLDVFRAYVDLESFQQEMEIAFLSNSYKYYPRSLIRTCLFPHSSQQFIDESGHMVTFDPSAFDTEDEAGVDLSVVGRKNDAGEQQASAYPILESYAKEKEKVKFFKANTMDELRGMVQRQVVSPLLFAGFDVGRTKHVSDLRILEEINLGNGYSVAIERYSEILVQMKFADQKRFIYDLLNFFPLMKIAIDGGGLGMDMAEELQEAFGSDRVEIVTFTVQWKADAAKDVKHRMEKQAIAIAEDRKTVEQINAIKRVVS